MFLNKEDRHESERIAALIPANISIEHQKFMPMLATRHCCNVIDSQLLTLTEVGYVHRCDYCSMRYVRKIDETRAPEPCTICQKGNVVFKKVWPSEEHYKFN